MASPAGACRGQTQRRPDPDGAPADDGGREAEGDRRLQETGRDRKAKGYRGHQEEAVVRKLRQRGHLLLLLEHIILRLPLPGNLIRLSLYMIWNSLLSIPDLTRILP